MTSPLFNERGSLLKGKLDSKSLPQLSRSRLGPQRLSSGSLSGSPSGNLKSRKTSRGGLTRPLGNGRRPRNGSGLSSGTGRNSGRGSGTDSGNPSHSPSKSLGLLSRHSSTPRKLTRRRTTKRKRSREFARFSRSQNARSLSVKTHENVESRTTY